MSGQPTLPPAPRAHDLPPRWDGHRVEWSGWEVEPWNTGRFHLRPDCCRACGHIASHHVLNTGVVMSEPGEVIPYRRPRTYAQAAANQAAERDGVGLGRLVAFRCPNCSHDTVSSMSRTAPGVEVWELDDTDYGDAGSNPPQGARPALGRKTR